MIFINKQEIKEMYGYILNLDNKFILNLKNEEDSAVSDLLIELYNLEKDYWKLRGVSTDTSKRKALRNVMSYFAEGHYGLSLPNTKPLYLIAFLKEIDDDFK